MQFQQFRIHDFPLLRVSEHYNAHGMVFLPSEGYSSQNFLRRSQQLSRLRSKRERVERSGARDDSCDGIIRLGKIQLIDVTHDTKILLFLKE